MALRDNWIKGAIKNPGSLTRSAKKAKMSPMSFSRKNKGAQGKTGQRSRFALLLASFNKKRV